MKSGQVIFDKRSKKKNLEFLKRLYYSTSLDGARFFFEKCLPMLGKGDRIEDTEMDLESFISMIPNNVFYHVRLQIGHVPNLIRYVMNITDEQNIDRFANFHCDLNEKNYMILEKIYQEIYGNPF